MENVYLEIIEKSDSLQKCCSQILKIHLAANKNNRGNLIAKSKRSYSHIQKIEEGEISKITFDTMSSIFGRILNNSELSTLIQKYYPEIGSTICRFSQNKPEEEPTTSEQLNKELTNVLASTLYQIAVGVAGTTDKDILQNFGSPGLKKIVRLLETGIIKEINGRYKLASDSDSAPMILDPATRLQMLKNNINSIDEDNLCSEKARLGNVYESVNLETLREVNSRMLAFIGEIYDIVMRDENRGNIPIAIGAFTKVLDTNKYDEEINQ